MSNDSYSVSDWNKELSILLIPNDVILSLYIIIGVIGNTLVILVYRFRMKKQSEDRYFIPFLALTDLCASFICASFGIALNMMQAEFTNNNLCKAWWFFAAFSTYMSVFLLTIIAVHRYLKVCRPLGSQMSLFWKRFSVGVALCLSVILGGPTSALYGSVEFPNMERNIVGRRCSKLKDVSKAASLAYGTVVIVFLIVCIGILIGFYGRIGYTIYRHFKYMSKQRLNGLSNPCSNDEHVTFTSESHSYDTKETISSELTCSQSEIHSNKIYAPKLGYGLQNTEKVAQGTNVASHKEDKEDITMDISESHFTARNVEKATRKQKQNNTKEESNRRVMYKFTVMFIVITIVFLICYIPKVILLVIEGLNPQFWENFTDTQRAGMLFLYRSYIINNIANVFIYAFMDKQFRKEAKLLLQFQKK